ncbi:Uma2 family endonuclease [Nocardia africana]|nr:Uma2 family endonuclease [Nocardia africana]
MRATSSSRRWLLSHRVRKVREYAALGIPQYWIIEHQPHIRIHRSVLGDDGYRWEPTVGEGSRARISRQTRFFRSSSIQLR